MKNNNSDNTAQQMKRLADESVVRHRVEIVSNLSVGFIQRIEKMGFKYLMVKPVDKKLHIYFEKPI